MKYQNKEELIKILLKDGMALREVEGDMRVDEDVVISALKGSLSAIQYVDKSFADNEKFIFRAIKETPWALYVYKFASDRVKAMEPILEEAIKGDGQSIAFADKRYHNRLALAHLALRAMRHPGVEYFGEGVRGNQEFMIETLKLYPREFHNLTAELKIDIPFLAKAVLANRNILKFLDKDLVNIVKDYIVESYKDREIVNETRENLG